MKKGFTLIELLAVILILGIIALIAIPTVNKIISEARYGAFKTSNDNIMKTIEQSCQASLIKGKNPVLSYIFTDGVSNNKIDIKGTLPNDGYIFLDRDCNITDYYLTDNKNIYSNGEDVRIDYMLKAPTEEATSILKTLYPDHYNNIINVNIVKNLNIPNNAIEVNDPSVSENGKIKSWLVPNESNYDLYIGSLEKIYTNYDSSYLFFGLSNVININLSNLNTSFTNNMEAIFHNCYKLVNLDLSNWSTNNVVNMKKIFYNCRELINIDLSSFNTDNVEKDGLINAFQNCYKLESLDLSNWNTNKITSFASLFNNCISLKYLDISTWDTSNVDNMYAMFSDLKSMTTLDVSHFITNKVTDMQFMFDGIEYGSGLIEIKGLENFDLSSLKYMGAMFAYSNKIKEIKFSNASTSKLESIACTWNNNRISLFNGCTSLTYIDLGSLNLINSNYLSMIFQNVPNLNKIKYNNAVGIDRLLEYIPTMDENNKGTFIVEDKNNITSQQISILNSKNWNVI